MQHQAWSVLDIKAVDPEQRIIEGIASTPTPDRSGDVMDPAGAKFTLPMPFLWFHDQKNPIGEVFEATVQATGIYIKARVATVTKPSRLKTLVDEAWSAFTAEPPLVRGLSIGWGAIESSPLPGGLTKFTKWIWGELSAVTVPMNTDATILSVKSIDLAASGLHAPGATGTPTGLRAPKGARAMTFQEQISGLEAKRAANLAAMTTIQTKASDEGNTKDAEQRDEFTRLKLEIKGIDDELVDLRDMEKLAIVQATPITPTTDQTKSSELRGGMPVITVRPNVPKGTAFARMCMAMAAGHGDSYQTLQYAKQWADSTPEVEQMVQHMWRTKAAVAVGTTTDATWAGPLVVTTPLNEFLEMLRPRTLLGRIPGMRQVPFNVSVPDADDRGHVRMGGPEQAEARHQSGLLDRGRSRSPRRPGSSCMSEELVKLSSPRPRRSCVRK